MRNIKLIIEYDGTAYAGWQIQNRAQSGFITPEFHQKKTIQEVLEKTLQQILQEKVKVIGSGRTDAGVHALAQAANFHTHTRFSLQKIQKALNSLLPKDIGIRNIFQADIGFNSCSSARSKMYRYCILHCSFSSPFLERYAWGIPYELDIPLMKKEARVLLGKHDFSSFCASATGVKSRIRTIKRISVKKTISCQLLAVRRPLLIIEIEADGFLYTMVRTIVGTLVEVGRGKLPRGSLRKILLAKDRRLAGRTAPAHGLFLVRVKY